MDINKTCLAWSCIICLGVTGHLQAMQFNLNPESAPINLSHTPAANAVFSVSIHSPVSQEEVAESSDRFSDKTREGFKSRYQETILNVLEQSKFLDQHKCHIRRHIANLSGPLKKSLSCYVAILEQKVRLFGCVAQWLMLPINEAMNPKLQTIMEVIECNLFKAGYKEFDTLMLFDFSSALFQ